MKIGMGRSRIRILTGALLILLAFLGTDAAAQAPKQTVLQKIRLGAHPKFTRLVFDAEGEKPSSVGPPSEEGLNLEFKGLQTQVIPEKIGIDPAMAISGIRFSKSDDGTFRIDVRFRRKGSTVQHGIMEGDPPHPGRYRVVMDISPSSGPLLEPLKAVPSAKDSPPQKPPDNTAAAKETAKGTPSARPAAAPAQSVDSLFNFPGSQATPEGQGPGPAEQAIAMPLPIMLDKAARNFSQSDYCQAYDLYDQALKSNLSGQKRTDALYALADCYFLMHQKELPEFGSRVIDYYLNALRADPKSLNAPTALYRLGLCYSAVGDRDRALMTFEQVTSSYPGHPLAGLSWIGMGQAHLQNKSLPESIIAFRSALTLPLGKADKAEAYYGLGKSLSMLNEHTQAVDSFQKSLGEDPLLYRKKPDMLKYLGESFFGIRQFGESQKYLLWYLNLLESIPDRDLLLSRISETLTNEGDDRLVKKLQSYLLNLYPDSEGGTIAQIRRAEALETRDTPTAQTQAGMIYQELVEKTLSEPLARLVRFKLASWELLNGNHEKSLGIVDDMLTHFKPKDETARAEFQGLRGKVVEEWLKKAVADKDYVRVIQLYLQNMNHFQSLKSAEFDRMVGDSYGELRLYPKALELYERMPAGADQKDDKLFLKMARYAFLMRDLDRAVQNAGQVRSPALEVPKAELMAQINFVQDKHPAVIQNLEKYFQGGKANNELSGESVAAYGESLSKVGRYQDALPWLQKAVSDADQNDPEQLVHLHLMLSQCYGKLKQQTKAIETLEAVTSNLKVDGSKDQLNHELAQLYLQTGQQDKAVQKLTDLAQSSESIWRSAAQQELDYIKMQNPQKK